ncbi:MAG: hypothetical protein ACQEVA_23080 [Myxococcota bacterium]
MMARIVGLAPVMIGVVASPYAHATPPCDESYESEPGFLDLSYTVPPDQEVICGVRAPEGRSLQLYEAVDWPNAGRNSDMEEVYWVDDEGRSTWLWRPELKGVGRKADGSDGLP